MNHGLWLKARNEHTAVSLMFFNIVSSELWRILQTDVLSIRENTSICWAAVEILVISPWYPASEMSCINITGIFFCHWGAIDAWRLTTDKLPITNLNSEVKHETIGIFLSKTIDKGSPGRMFNHFGKPGGCFSLFRENRICLLRIKCFDYHVPQTSLHHWSNFIDIGSWNKVIISYLKFIIH